MDLVSRIIHLLLVRNVIPLHLTRALETILPAGSPIVDTTVPEHQQTTYRIPRQKGACVIMLPNAWFCARVSGRWSLEIDMYHVTASFTLGGCRYQVVLLHPDRTIVPSPFLFSSAIFV